MTIIHCEREESFLRKVIVCMMHAIFAIGRKNWRVRQEILLKGHVSIIRGFKRFDSAQRAPGP